MPSTIRMPRGVQRRLEAAVSELLYPVDGGRNVDFTQPPGEEALVPPDSVSWRIFKNPVSLFVGGVAAVILELAEPTIRTALWTHSSFRTDPLSRFRRTGLAAMITVYGARSIAEPMIARIVRVHSHVAGNTAAGIPYRANDPFLLTWVHATAAYAFAQAYCDFVEPLSPYEMDSFYREGGHAARLYGASHAPQSSVEWLRLVDSMKDRLEASSVIHQFLQIMRTIPVVPRPLAWLQPFLVRAAVDVIPGSIRDRLGLTDVYGLRRLGRWAVHRTAAIANRVVLRESPAAQSCSRLKLSSAYLYGG